MARGAPPGWGVLLISVSGNNQDTLAAAEAAIAGGGPVFAALCEVDSKLARQLRASGHGEGIIAVPKPPLGQEFVGPHRGVPFTILATRLYTELDWVRPIRRGEPVPAPAERPGLIVSLGAGLAAPAALDFAQRALESGFAPALCTDPRDFSHGGFMAITERQRSTLVVVFAMASQRAYLERYCARFPSTLPCLRIEAAEDGPSGALELMTAGLRTFHAALERQGLAPTYASVPEWGRDLHHTSL